MFYRSIRDIADPKDRARTISGLRELRTALNAQIPAKTATDTLLLATWNLREFDKGKYGYRTDESYFYIAEILDRFDLIAIQEVRNGLYPLQRLARLMGEWWDFLVADVTLGPSGNSERLAFLYDSRKVSFTGLAAELVLPKVASATAPPLQFARTPYLAGFRAGWAYFTLVTVHIYYGQGVPVDERRLQEIETLAKTIARNAGEYACTPRWKPDERPVDPNVLLLGDFNIFRREDRTMEALTKADFVVPDQLLALPEGSNVERNKYYDQIAYLKSLYRMSPKNAGIFDFYEQVYRLDDEPLYESVRAGEGGSFKEWRTYQMSDHLPMWVEFGINDSDAYLAKLAAEAGGTP